MTPESLAMQPLPALSEADRALFKQASEDACTVVTAETIFYAQGGGQPSDSGTMSSDNGIVFEVSSVRNASEGRILHLGKFTTPGSTFHENDSVHQAIDGVKRIHTGGHIVDLAVRHLSESIPGVKELKAQHYPDSAFVEFQGLIDGKHKEAIEVKANDFVRRALPVKVYWWNVDELREECCVVSDNVVIPEGELVRAVDIEGAGAYPCGGTHVSDSSVVGRVHMRKISRQKGISKVSYMPASRGVGGRRGCAVDPRGGSSLGGIPALVGDCTRLVSSLHV
jgi:Ser-tRNA(Ala) deacylase AlaX